MKTVLIGEDEAVIRIMLVDHLEECDYEVREAGTANEAIAFEGEVQSVDAVVAESRMPGRSTASVGRLVAAARNDGPGIVTSGYVTMAEVNAANPNVRIVSKPYEFSELRAAVRAVPGRSTTADVHATPGPADPCAACR